MAQNQRTVLDELVYQMQSVGYSMSDKRMGSCLFLIGKSVADWAIENKGNLDTSDRAWLISEYRPDWTQLGLSFHDDMEIIDRLDWVFVYACEKHALKEQ